MYMFFSSSNRAEPTVLSNFLFAIKTKQIPICQKAQNKILSFFQTRLLNIYDISEYFEQCH